MASTLSINLEGSSRRLEWDPKDKESLLGEGAFGSVFRGTLDYLGVAVKVIKKFNRNSERTPDEAAASGQHGRELRRLLKLPPHPCIVQFLGAARDPITKEMLIVTELLPGGSLHDALTVMRSYGSAKEGGAALDERSFLSVGLNIAAGLRHLHSEQVTHGDIKPHNVLLSARMEILDNGRRARFRHDGRAKLTDFGLSRRTVDLQETAVTSDFGAGPVGTFAYMAPEAFDGFSTGGPDLAKAADVFAFAVVMYELLCGRQPWCAENVRSFLMLYRLVCNEGRRPSWGPRRRGMRPEYIAFVERCWAQNPEKRPTSLEVAKQFNDWDLAFKRRKADEAYMKQSSPNGIHMKDSSPLFSDFANGPAEYMRINSEQPQAVLPRLKSMRRDVDEMLDSFTLYLDSSGKQSMRRVVTTRLSEKETSDAVRRFAPLQSKDMGASSDTHMEESSDKQKRNGFDRIGSEAPVSFGVFDCSLSLSDLSAQLGPHVKRVESQKIAAPPLPTISLPVANGCIPPLPGMDRAKQGNGKGNTADPMCSFLGAVARLNQLSDPNSTDAQAPSNPAPTNVDVPKKERTNANGTAAEISEAQSTNRPDVYGSNQQVPIGLETSHYTPQILYQTAQVSSLQKPQYYNSSYSAYYNHSQVWNGRTRPWHSLDLSSSTSHSHFNGHAASQFTVHSALSLIQGPSPRQVLDKYWAAGNAQLIAQAFAEGATSSPPLLSGKTYLDLALVYIRRNNKSGPKLSTVARDLCLTVGTLASNSNDPIDKTTAKRALPTTLSAIQSFQKNAAVYSSCCFAMSNLLHISNQIENAVLRKTAAAWIIHAISWNQREKKLASLAYTATCAARNFLWLNEANANTLLSEASHNPTLPLTKLLHSFIEFRSNESVVDTSLSTLGMVAYFPALRPQFALVGGIAAIVGILLHSLRRVNAASMCLSVLTCITSDPASMGDDDRAAMCSALLKNDACGAVVHALYFSLHQWKQEGQSTASLRLMDEALATMATLCEFDEMARSAMVDRDAVTSVAKATRELSAPQIRLMQSSLLVNCAMQTCNTICALAKSKVALEQLRDANIRSTVDNLKLLSTNDPRVEACIDNALVALG